MSLNFIKLKAKNFVLYEEFEIDFRDLEGAIVFITGKNLDIAGADSNYSGKSIIGDIITDLLFDKTIRRHVQNSFIGSFSKSCSSSLIIKEDNLRKKYLIQKFRNHPKHGDKLFFVDISNSKKKKNLSRKTKADTYKVIWKVLGINWNTFKNRNFYGQSDNERFLRVSDAKKADIIIDIQDLKDLDAAKGRASLNIKAAKRSLENLNRDLNSAISSLKLIEESILKSKKSKLKRIFFSRKDLKRVKAEIEDANSCINKISIENINKEICSVENDLSLIEADVKEGEELSNVIVKLKNNIDLQQNELASEMKQGERISAKILLVKKETADLKNQVITRCSKCGANLTTERMKKTFNSLKLEEDKLLNKADLLKKEIICLNRGIAEEKIKLKSCEKKFVPLRKSINRKKDLDQNIKELNSSRIKIIIEEKNIAVLEEKAKNLRRKIEDIKAEKIEAISAKTTIIDSIKNLEKEISEYDREKEKNEFSKIVFDKTIRSIFNSFLDQLNYTANLFLETLCDNEISVMFSPRVERKSKKVVDEINVLVSVGGAKPRNFRTYSGGERGRVELVTQLALFSASDSNIPFLFLDEPFTGIDLEGRNRIVQLLQDIGQKGNRVMVISNKIVPNGYGSQLQVVRENGQSILSFSK